MRSESFRTVTLLPLVRVRFGLALMLFHYKFLFTIAYVLASHQASRFFIGLESCLIHDDQSRSGRVIQVPSL